MYEGCQKKSAPKKKERKSAPFGEVLFGAWQEESFQETSYGVLCRRALERRRLLQGGTLQGEGNQHLKEVNKKLCQRQKKIKKTRKDLTNLSKVQRYQEHIRHQISEEESAYSKN